MDLIRLVLILVTVIKCVLSREKLKSFAYCHFLKGETSIEMLSCGKCLYNNEELKFYLSIDSNQQSIFKNQLISKYCAYYFTKLNKHQHTINKDEDVELSLLPNLKNDWFSNDLIYLIQKQEIITNLDDPTMLHQIPAGLKIIELIDLGIESISLNAFKHFTNLRILNLAFNKLSFIDFSLLNDSKSTLIELDLSHNKITTIKQQQINLTNLRLLNISNNFLVNFNISQISSKLQILDLSFNSIKKLTNLVDNSSTSLNNLIYLNINSNHLSTFNDLLFVDNSKNNNSMYLLNECNSNNRIDVYLHNNKWKCTCDSFEYFFKIEQTNDCLYEKFKLNLDNQINCSLDESMSLVDWFDWYNTTCGNNSNYSANDQSKLQNRPTDPDHVVSTQQFYFFWNTPTTLINRPQNLTTKILKYDMSTAFYWISSFCVAIITISCLFIVWFYCFKRFKFTRHGLIPERVNQHNNSNQNQRQFNRANNRQDLSRFVIRDQANNSAYPMAIYRQFRQGRSDASDLYFISLSNRNSNRVFANNLRQNPVNLNSFPQQQQQQHDNFGYIHNDDEPPSYYDAILIKNNRLSICKENNSSDMLASTDTRLNNLRRTASNRLNTNSINNNNNQPTNDLVLNPNNLTTNQPIGTSILTLSRHDSLAATILLNDRMDSELSDDSLETTRQNQLN